MSSSAMSDYNPSNSSEWTRGPVIGSGSFGDVYLATCVYPDGFLQQFAVKTAPIRKSSSLQNEKNIFDVLQGCPEILTCYSGQESVSVESERIVYNLLLEYAPAGTLFDIICRITSPMPECEVRAYTRMILKGLDYVHAKGFVHCDIKPANILAFPSKDHRNCKYQLKLADFGLAVGPGVRWRKPSKGEVHGTLLYLSPELALEGNIGPATDIWSLGCTVLQMITRADPWAKMLSRDFTDNDFFELIGKLTPDIPSGVSACGKDFLKKCFERDPKARWTAWMLLHHPFVNPTRTTRPRFLMPHEMMMK